MAKKKQEVEQVVEAEFTEVEGQAAEQEEGKPIKTGLVVAMTEDGDIHFNFLGSDQNLLVVEGLLQYARKHMDKVWQDRVQ